MKRREGPSDGLKLRVLKRDSFRCSICGASGEKAELQVDHIIPVSKGGSHHIGNLQAACRKCNQKKGNRFVTNTGCVQSHIGLTRDEMGAGGLLGMFVHLRGGEVNELTGKPHIEMQGQIVGFHKDKILVQLFSYLDGRATTVEVFDESEVLAANLYLSGEEWLAEGDRDSKAYYYLREKELQEKE